MTVFWGEEGWYGEILGAGFLGVAGCDERGGEWGKLIEKNKCQRQ